MAQVLLVLRFAAALVLIVATSSVVATFSDELSKLGELYKQGTITAVEFQQAKAFVMEETTTRNSMATDLHGNAALREELSSLVTNIMLSEKMTKLFATLIKSMVAAGPPPTSATQQMQRRLSSSSAGGGGVSCSLQSCGDTTECSSWNKDIDDVHLCSQCGLKKFSVNELFHCNCEYTCEIAAPETPAVGAGEDQAAAQATLGDDAATASVAGTSLWIEGDEGKIAFGKAGDVCLSKDADALRVEAAGLAVDGGATVAGKLHATGGARVAGGLSVAAAGDGSAYDEVLLSGTGYNSGNPRLYVEPRTSPGSGTVNTFVHLRSKTDDHGENPNVMGLLVDGAIGIGVAHSVSENAKLDVSSGNVRLSSNYNLEWGGSQTAIYGHNTNGINFLTQGATRLKIEDGGNIGVGNIPTGQHAGEALDVRGSIKVSGMVDGVDVSDFKSAFDQVVLPSGALQLQAVTADCTGELAGAMRYHQHGVQFCTGTAWTAIYSPPPTTCSDVYNNDPGSKSGKYTLETSIGKAVIYCSFRGQQAWALVLLSNRGARPDSAKHYIIL